MTLPFQEQHTPPDHHYHVCEGCSLSFSHHKSRIPPGGGHLAHTCPNCGQQVNSVQQVIPLGLSIDFGEWYGRDLAGHLVRPVKPKKGGGK